MEPPERMAPETPAGRPDYLMAGEAEMPLPQGKGLEHARRKLMARKNKKFRRWKRTYPRTLEHPGGTIAIIYSDIHARTIGRDYRRPGAPA